MPPTDAPADTPSAAPWPPAGCPALAWPNLSAPDARPRWQRAVVDAYGLLWAADDAPAPLAPVPETALTDLEARLGCALPPALRAYHRALGVLSLAETLCGATPGADTPIQPLCQAYPGLSERSLSPAEGALADELVAFGDYLGNGNLFCFHRRTGEVYYFDHDTGAPLSRFFPACEDYLDALMVRCLGEIYADDDAAEALLAARFGQPLVEKWLY